MATLVARLPPPRLRSLVIGIGTLLAMLVATQLVFPGSKGGGRGTPMAIVFIGLAYGLVTSLSAVGLVLVYRSVRVINFAQGAVGTVTFLLLFQFLQHTDLPFPLSFLLCLLFATLLGVVAGIYLLRFFNSSRLFVSTVTIVGYGAFLGLLPWVLRLPFFPPLEERSGATNPDLRQLLPFSDWHFRIGDFPARLGFSEVFAIEVAVFALAGIAVFLRYTKPGIALRALAENPERASLLGIGVAGLSVIVWTLAGALDGTYVMATGILGVQGLAGPAAFLPPLAAAVLARMHNIGAAVFSSVVIGITYVAFRFSYPARTELYFVILYAIVAACLLLQRRGGQRTDAGAAVSWVATEEPRPIPKELAGIPSIRLARYALYVVLLGFVVLFPFVASTGRVNLGGVIAINSIAVLSLVVLTGWTGQVSLGQYAFVAIGAVVGGGLTARAGISFWLALPLGALVCSAVALLVGLPALRLRGLFLMVMTFGLAVVVQLTLFEEDYFGWLLPKSVDRPTFFLLDFEEERSMYFLCVIALALCIWLVSNMRRSRVGRILIAVRENEANAESFGVSVVRAKLLGFAVSGALSGFAGVLYAHHQRGVSRASFGVLASLFVFVDAVVGGVSSPFGAMLGAGYRQISGEILSSNELFLAFFQSQGPLLILFIAPGGLVSLVNKLRDSVLRIVAQRRQLIVPSLFADYDPDALARRLIPLGEQETASGLAALPGDQRYALESELYEGTGVRVIDRLAPPREALEAVAISAAVRSVTGDGDGDEHHDEEEAP